MYSLFYNLILIVVGICFVLVKIVIYKKVMFSILKNKLILFFLYLMYVCFKNVNLFVFFLMLGIGKLIVLMKENNRVIEIWRKIGN